ncbi:MAG TPA: nucleotide sugar dehydrogenase [Aggregatilineales bacterium]|nr:nucleotide sugar dehydrogenase [Aggregatilineales bacterium]
MENICVIGVGYVGLVTGTCFADLGNRVIALDINEKRIENLRKAILPIYEPGLQEVVERNIKADRLHFTTSYEEALKDAEFAFICVGTPEGVDGEADLQYVRMAAETIARKMDHPLIIVNKSTVPVGTGDWVAQIIRENQPKPIQFSVVSCPEFLREGSALRDFQNPDRTVLGSTDREACNRVAQIHLPLRAPIVVTDLRTAEMIKYASNAFLATRISFINEIANICEMLGADVKEVAQGMGYDKRIGHHFLESGVGYGGSCFQPEETVFTVDARGCVAVEALEALFAESGEPITGSEIEVVRPANQQVLGFNLYTGCPEVALVRAVTRRPYNGNMVTVKAADDVSLTVTADHPVIVRAEEVGFEVVSADRLLPGDELMKIVQFPVEMPPEFKPKRPPKYGEVFTIHPVQNVTAARVNQMVYSLETTTGTVLIHEAIVIHNCFPKDVKALAYMAQTEGGHPQLLQAVIDINSSQRKRIILKLEDILGSLSGKTIGLLGLAFKENTDDIRVSPSLDIAELLHEQGAIVRGYDPVAMENTAQAYPYIQMAQDAYNLAQGCDALVVATPWNEFKSLDMRQIHAVMKQPVIIDGRNLYDGNIMRAIGFDYRGVGRGYKGKSDYSGNGK